MTMKNPDIMFNGIKYTLNKCGAKWYRSTTIPRKMLHKEIWKDKWGIIPDGFIIHHIDGNPICNNIENLCAMSTSEHGNIHARESWDNREFFEYICKECNKSYFSMSKKAGFCSKLCYSRNAERNKKYYEERLCVICNNVFLTRKSKDTKTCSKSCANKLWRN